MKVDKKKLVETCKTILSSADLDTITEKKVRRQVESELGLEDKLLDNEPFKGFVKESVNKVINDLSQKSESSRSPPRAKKTESRSTTKPASISKNPRKVEAKSEESSKAFEDEYKPLNSKARSKITKQSSAESSPKSKTQAQNKVSKTYGESRTVSSSSKSTNGEEQSKKPEDVSKIDDKSSSSKPAKGNFTSRSSKQTGQANKSKAMGLNKEIPSEEESEPAKATKKKLSSTKSVEANKQKQKLSVSRSRIKSKVSISSDTDDNISNFKSDSEEPPLPKRRRQIKIVTSDEDEVPSIKVRVKEEKGIANSRVRVREEKEIASSKMRVKEEKGIARVRVKEEKEEKGIARVRVKEEKEEKGIARVRVKEEKEEKEIASSKMRVKEEKEEKEIASSKVGAKEEKEIASSKVCVKEEKEIASSKVCVKEEKEIASVKEEKGTASSKVGVKEEKGIVSKMGVREEEQTRHKIVAVEDGGFIMALENELLAQNSDIIGSKDPIGLSGDDIDSDNTIKGEDEAEVYENDRTFQNNSELIGEIEQEPSGSKTDSTSPKRTIDSVEDEDSNDLSLLEDDEPQKKKRNTGKTSAKPINNKSTVEKDDKRIKSLKSLINKCGVRKIWAKELVNCNTDSSKIRKLKQILTDLGVEGRPTLEKCKKVKRRLELEAELRAMNADNIISDDVKETRKARASRGIFNPLRRRVSHANESSPEYNDTSSEDKNSDSE